MEKLLNYYKIKDCEPSQLKAVGSALKKLMILISKSDYANSSFKLEEIIKGLKWDPKKDVLICILEDTDYGNALHLISDYGIKYILSFGPGLSDIFGNVDHPYYRIATFESFIWLPVPPLENILLEKESKMKLWKALNQLVQINL